MGFLTQPSAVSNLNELSALILSEGPSAYYIGNDATALVLPDHSGNGLDLAANGAPVPASSPLVPCDPDGLYLRLPTGANSYFRANPFPAPIRGSWSVLSICCPNDFTGAVNMFCIAGAGELETENFQVDPRLFTTGEFQSFWESGAGVDRITASGIVFNEGIPALYGMVKDQPNSRVLFYRNGILIASVPYATEPSGGTACNMAVGDARIASSSGECIIGHVAFYLGQVLPASFFANVALRAGLFGPGYVRT